MHVEQRLAARDPIPELHFQRDACGRRPWRSCQLGNHRQLPVVDGGHHARCTGKVRSHVRRHGRLAKATLRLADGNKLGPGLPAVQRLLRKRIACTGAGFSAHLQKVPGEQQRPLAEIRRGRRVPLQDGEDIPRLESGTDASTETAPALPCDVGSIACDDANSTGDVATRTATFRLAAGETIVIAPPPGLTDGRRVTAGGAR